MGNPKATIDAILESEKQIGGLTVYPLSVARYALLEKYKSPFLTGEDDIQRTITSLYIMTQPAAELAKHNANGTLETDALIWSDAVGVRELKRIMGDIQEKLKELLYISVDDDEDNKKKEAPTAG